MHIFKQLALRNALIIKFKEEEIHIKYLKKKTATDKEEKLYPNTPSMYESLFKPCKS